MIAGSTLGVCSDVRRWFASELRMGSWHVTSTSEPQRFDTMRCAPAVTFAGSGSVTKSFMMRSRVVVHAMVTDCSTTR
jgi:hypothetical protein